MRTIPISSVALARLQLTLMAGAIVGFFVSNVATVVQARAIDSNVDAIVGDAMPSVQALSTARGDLHRLDTHLERYVHTSAVGKPMPKDVLEGYQQGIDASLATYVALPSFPQERPLYDEVAHATDAVKRSVAATVSAVETRDWRLAEAALAEQRLENHRAGRGLERLIAFNTAYGQRLGQMAMNTRRSSTLMAFTLDTLVGLLAMVATGLAVVALRRSVGSLEVVSGEAQRRALTFQERSSELEQFAGRVAHDILSPMMAIGLGLEFAKKRLETDAAAIRSVDRATRNLMHVRRIVVGLLDFARAGARADPEACADLRECIQSVLDHAQGEADAAQVELKVENFENSSLKCSPGVLASLVDNLVRNAIKYMDDSPQRRVCIRVVDTGAAVRVEVEDTGPGIPAEIQASLFEPFFRAGGTSVPGAGLGLATVKKLAQAHGGRAGCRSEPGAGSLFWFEIPRAQCATESAIVPS